MPVGDNLSRSEELGEGEEKMAFWLFKQEPSCYSFADLRRDGKTAWDGVSNALARKYLRQVKRGDRIFFYHTGKEKAVVAEMTAASNAKEAATDRRPPPPAGAL